MATVTLPVTEHGIVIPRSTANLLGCRLGGWAAIEVRPLPSSEELKKKAVLYALHNLGDALCVDDPVWVDDGWRLNIRIKGRRGTYGYVSCSVDGEVDGARSTSIMELLHSLNAEDTASSTTE